MQELEELVKALRDNGYDLPNPPIDKPSWHRFGKDKNQWFIAGTKTLSNGKSGILANYGDWSTGEKFTWFSNSGNYSNEDRELLKEEIEKQKALHEEERKRKNSAAAKEAKILWQEATPTTSHPYLDRKQIGIQEITKLLRTGSYGELLIPMGSDTETLTGIERIYADGSKYFLSGQRKHGCFFIIPGAEETTRLYICEGFATAASVALSTRNDTACAFDAGNLLPVCNTLRKIYPTREFILCADNDAHKPEHGNVGVKNAVLAADSCGGLVVVPEFPVDTSWEGDSSGTDFNDLHCMVGLMEVRRQIEDQIRKHSKDKETGIQDAGTCIEGRDDNKNWKANQSDGQNDMGAAKASEEERKTDEKTEEVLKRVKPVTQGDGNADESARDWFRKELINASKNSSLPDEAKKIASKIIDRVFYTTKTPFNMSQNFLKDEGFTDEDGKSFLRYYRNEFYRYRTTHYQKLDDEWLVDKITRWMINNDWKSFAGTSKVNNIMNVMKVKPIYVGAQLDLPAHNDLSSGQFGEWQTVRNIVPLTNGLLDAKEEKLLPHSPNFFFNYSLPFKYDPDAKCPIYDKICAEIFSSEEEIMVWDEILGIHIYNPFLIEKMFLLHGIGANGKSVMTTIQGCLLGSENISSVPIECFSPNNFAFIETLGKLANIIPDMKDVDKFDEGALKAFISREEMSFNRKNKPVVKARPTAFLTACTNVLPKFSDKTDGIWRRVLLLEFKKQIPVEERNPKYRDPKFWVESGELPGIFNKALKGAKRVERRGAILETEDLKLAVEDYRQELNYASQFARECLEYGNHRAPSHPIYVAFRNMVNRSGGRSCASKTFFNQLKQEAKIMGNEVDLTRKTERKDNYLGKFLVGAKLNEFGESLSIVSHREEDGNTF